MGRSSRTSADTYNSIDSGLVETRVPGGDDQEGTGYVLIVVLEYESILIVGSELPDELGALEVIPELCSNLLIEASTDLILDLEAEASGIQSGGVIIRKSESSPNTYEYGHFKHIGYTIPFSDGPDLN